MSTLLHTGRATYAFFERNWNLTKRYWAWEIVWLCYNVVNALSITFIARATPGLNEAQVNYMILYLLIGTSVW
ncbi:MAG TPA: ABC transporter permease, partial [Ktedonobacteraceae bacterium]